MAAVSTPADGKATFQVPSEDNSRYYNTVPAAMQDGDYCLACQCGLPSSSLLTPLWAEAYHFGYASGHCNFTDFFVNIQQKCNVYNKRSVSHHNQQHIHGRSEMRLQDAGNRRGRLAAAVMIAGRLRDCAGGCGSTSPSPLSSTSCVEWSCTCRSGGAAVGVIMQL